ncbi:apolipoprotein N-acyltransferase [bacterium]|nr:apolipoprotein N-acyltransferase [bacterium]
MRFLKNIIDRWRQPRGRDQWVAGALAVLALPPFFFWPVLPFSLGMLWNGVRQAVNRKQLFVQGWWWGFGYFMAGLYWFACALLTDAAQFGWLIPFALTIIPAVLAIYTGITCLLAGWFKPRGVAGTVCFAASWVLLEWLRGMLFTGFPWNLIGYSLSGTLATLQLASLGGVWGMGFAAVFLSLLPWLGSREEGWRKGKGLGTALAVLALLMAGGQARLAQHPLKQDGPVVRIVQPNIQQHMKWSPEMRAKAVFEQMRMSRMGENEQPSHIPRLVVWPETAVPYIWSEGFFLRPVLAQAVPPNGGALLTGIIREAHEDLYNAMLVLKQDARLEGSYEKRHLVPFGEFVPFRNILPLVAMVYGGKDFSRGEGGAVLTLPGIPPVRPLICYEAIFPEDIWDGQGTRPEWLVNITNDAWFGDSTGPHQHFEAARLRAVEQGVPLVRAANTGISAVVDGNGRIVRMLSIGVKGTITESMPAMLEAPLYARHSYLIINLIVILLTGSLCYLYRADLKTI